MNNENMKRFIDETLVGKKKVPYIDVCVMRDHEQIMRYGSGFEPVTGKEKVFLYSCTKPLTVTTAMRLIEDGKLGLDDPVMKYLPGAARAFVLDKDGNKTVCGDRMTVRQLFTMTAGFSYDRGDLYARFKDTDAGTVEVIDALFDRALDFEPGYRFNYSLCHDVLAAVVEAASGMRFGEYMKKVLFDPLGMTHSTFDASIWQETEPRYQYTPDGIPVKLGNSIHDFVLSRKYESGGAGLISTVDDYILFADTLACGGKTKDGYRLLKPESIDLLRTEQITTFAVDQAFSCAQGDDYGYALGMRTRMRPTAWGMGKGEFGWDGACGCYVMMDPERHISVYAGMNIGGWSTIIRGDHIELVHQIYRDMGLAE